MSDISIKHPHYMVHPIDWPDKVVLSKDGSLRCANFSDCLATNIVGSFIEKMFLYKKTDSTDNGDVWVRIKPKKMESTNERIDRIRKLREDMMKETLDDITKAIGYKPDHNNEFSGDILVQMIHQLVGEHKVMLERLMELEEISIVDRETDTNGRPYWSASGEPIFVAEKVG